MYYNWESSTNRDYQGLGVYPFLVHCNGIYLEVVWSLWKTNQKHERYSAHKNFIEVLKMISRPSSWFVSDFLVLDLRLFDVWKHVKIKTYFPNGGLIWWFTMVQSEQIAIKKKNKLWRCCFFPAKPRFGFRVPQTIGTPLDISCHVLIPKKSKQKDLYSNWWFQVRSLLFQGFIFRCHVCRPKSDIKLHHWLRQFPSDTNLPNCQALAITKSCRVGSKATRSLGNRA